MLTRTLVVAGTASGVGKTTVALGLIAALRRRGLAVQPFKVGPDYIDPSHHAVAAGRPSRNLDSWMLPEGAVRELFARAARDADLALVEGVMGLFDGRSGAGEAGSTAHVARLLGAPVLLVVDAAKAARSVAATVLGFARFDPSVPLAGVLLNNVASERHRRLLVEAVEGEARLPVLGWLPRDAAPRQEERYLGLVPAAERALPDGVLDRLAEAVARGVELDRVLAAAADVRPGGPDAGADGLFPPAPVPTRARIAVARDAAFSFYYEDNLDLLSAWGAEVVPFSPLEDARLPDGASALYLGGGFPELFAERLAANRSMLEDVRRAVVAGMPTVAECGGLMYLGERLTDRDGREHRMAGVLSIGSTIARGRLALGYRDVRALRDSPLLRAGEPVRGHEFHWSVAGPPPPDRAAYAWTEHDGSERAEGYASASLLASYVHLHFGAHRSLAPRFVEAAARWRESERPISHARETSRAASCHPERSEGSPVPARQAWEILRSAQDAREVRGAPDGLTPQDRALGGRHRPLGAAPGPNLRAHGLPPAAIESLSMRRIAERYGDRLPPTEPARSLVARLVYAAGDPSLIDAVRIGGDAVGAAVAALRAGRPLVVDVRMVAAGLDARTLDRLGVERIVALDEPGAAEIAKRERITRTAAGILALGAVLDGAVVAIGNAPTALLAVLDLIDAGVARPAAVLGLPVGFVAAAESKELLARADVPHLTVLGTRGGSALAAAAANHLARLAASSAEAGHNHSDDRAPQRAAPG